MANLFSRISAVARVFFKVAASVAVALIVAQATLPTTALAAPPTSCTDGTTGVPAGSVVLRGEYLCIGLSDKGTMGVGGSTDPGIRHAPGGNVAVNGNYDYLTPGSPYDGFSIQADNINGGVFQSNTNGGAAAFTGTLTDSSAGADNSATWTSTNHASYDLSKVYSFNDADQTLKVSVTITAKEDIVNLRYLRSMDPDAKASSGDSSSTKNALGYGSLPATDFVYTEALDSKVVLSMYSNSTVSHEAKLFSGCCSIVSPDTPSHATNGTGDWGVGIAFYIGDLANGDSVVLEYEYRFAASLDLAAGGPGKPDIDTAKPGGYTIDDVNAGNVNPTFDGGTLALGNSGTINAGFTVNATNGTVNTGSNNVTFTGNFTGAGQVSKSGGGTMTLSGNNTNTGGFKVAGGTLNLTTGGTIAGDVSVGAGSTFVGNGTVGGDTTVDGAGSKLSGAGTFNGDVIIRNGALHAPGNSPGRVIVGGNYTLEPAGSLEIELASDGSSDVIDVAGTTTLNGRLQVLGFGTGFVGANYTYTVVENAVPVVGDFSGFNNDLAFYTVSYTLFANGANDVGITLTRNANTFTGIALTPNQTAAGKALDAMPTTEFANIMGLLTPTEVRGLLNSLSGEIYASAAAVLSDDMARSLAGRTTGNATPFTPQCGFTSSGRTMSDAERASCVIANSFRIVGKGDLRTITDGNTGRTNAAQAGLEGQILFPFELDGGNSHAYVGTTFSHGRGWIDIGNPSSTANTASSGLGLVAGWQQNGLELTGALGANWGRVDGNRSIAGTASSGSFDMAVLGGSLGVSYAVEMENGLTMRPFAAITHAATVNGAFAETSASGLRYSGTAGSSSQTLATLGLSMSAEFEMEDYVVRPRGQISLTQRIAGGPGAMTGTIGSSAPFTTLGVNGGDTVVGLGLGVTLVKSDGLTFDADYALEASGSSISHRASVSAKVQF